jgi:hypothetical protein
MVAINGFLVSPDRAAIGIKTYQVPGTDVYLPVRSEIAPLLIGFAAEWHATVEPLIAGGCWGYAYRNVRGADTPSFHAGGLAIDLNAPQHPLGVDPRASFTPRQMTRIRALASKYGLRWGGDYTGRKDGMHAEVILPREQALDLVRRLQNPKPTDIIKEDDDMTPDQCRRELERFFGLQPGETFDHVFGDADGSNKDLFTRLTSLAQTNVNEVRAIRSGVGQTLDAVRNSAQVTGDDEVEITAALQSAETRLAALIEAQGGEAPPPAA